MKFVLFCAIFGIYSNVFVEAMYNGEYRSVKDYPYMVQLYYKFEDRTVSFCGAAILSEYWIISAAHCVRFEGVVTNKVRSGSSTTLENGVLFDIEKVFVHGDCYQDFAWDNDIALIKLKTPMTFNEYQQPIKITRVPPKIGDNITVLGFGDHHHFVEGTSLRVAETSVIEDEVCLNSYELEFTKNQICTSVKNVDLCYGDSGGPAVHNNKLIGIIAQGCEYTKPNILTKLANYYDWIFETTGIKYIDEELLV